MEVSVLLIEVGVIQILVSLGPSEVCELLSWVRGSCFILSHLRKRPFHIHVSCLRNCNFGLRGRVILCGGSLAVKVRVTLGHRLTLFLYIKH